MSKLIVQAIFDNGVFRPLVAVSLHDQTRVHLTVETDPAVWSLHGETESEDEIVARQRRAFMELDALLAAFPDNSPDDGFTSADHDRILYGDPSDS